MIDPVAQQDVTLHQQLARYCHNRFCLASPLCHTPVELFQPSVSTGCYLCRFTQQVPQVSTPCLADRAKPLLLG
jgi:hypothetical protein